MSNTRTRQTTDDTFRLIEAAAVNGERCPLSTQTGGPLLSGTVTALAHGGRISVEISGHNWRQVTILEGPNAGRRTASNPNPNLALVYLTIDKRGTLRNGKRIDSGTNHRQQPSSPRPLTRDELK